MISQRRALGALLVVLALLVVAAPVASARAAIKPFAGVTPGGQGIGVGAITPVSGACGIPTGAENQGGTGGTNNSDCLGAGLVFNGPQIGQIASVVGPTVIGPAVVGTSIVSAGDAAAH
jgi:hypothetical protein